MSQSVIKNLTYKIDRQASVKIRLRTFLFLSDPLDTMSDLGLYLDGFFAKIIQTPPPLLPEFEKYACEFFAAYIITEAAEEFFHMADFFSQASEFHVSRYSVDGKVAVVLWNRQTRNFTCSILPPGIDANSILKISHNHAIFPLRDLLEKDAFRVNMNRRIKAPYFSWGIKSKSEFPVEVIYYNVPCTLSAVSTATATETTDKENLWPFSWFFSRFLKW